jgi:hypothetical protein
MTEQACDLKQSSGQGPKGCPADRGPRAVLDLACAAMIAGNAQPACMSLRNTKELSNATIAI